MGRTPTKYKNMPPRLRPRKQRSGKIYYYYDTGAVPRVEIPLGDDYVLAVKKWAELEADKSDRSAALEKTRKELDEQLAADAQRIKAFKIAGLALLGALGTSITGTPIYIGALAGGAAGFVWSRFG